MPNGDEEKREVPEVEAAFTSLLKRFRIGAKDLSDYHLAAPLRVRACNYLG